MSTCIAPLNNHSSPKNNCQYELAKGTRKGQICGKGCKGKFCHDHKKKGKEPETVFNQEENDQEIVSTICPSEIQTKENSIISNSNPNDDIFISKHFVYDCIREFFREHNEMTEILGNKPKSNTSSSLTSMLGIAGVSLLPLLLKNFSNFNIQDAICKSEYTNEIRNGFGIPNQPQRTNNTIERDERTQTGQFQTNETNRENQPTPSSSSSPIGKCKV